MTDEYEVDSGGLFDALMKLPSPEGYTAMDRYRDFRQLFMGSEQGTRVLREILAWGHMFRPGFSAGGPIDPYRLSIHEGERNMALRLLGTINSEPVTKPAQVNRKKD